MKPKHSIRTKWDLPHKSKSDYNRRENKEVIEEALEELEQTQTVKEEEKNE